MVPNVELPIFSDVQATFSVHFQCCFCTTVDVFELFQELLFLKVGKLQSNLYQKALTKH